MEIMVRVVVILLFFLIYLGIEVVFMEIRFFLMMVLLFIMVRNMSRFGKVIIFLIF